MCNSSHTLRGGLRGLVLLLQREHALVLLVLDLAQGIQLLDDGRVARLLRLADLLKLAYYSSAVIIRCKRVV